MKKITISVTDDTHEKIKDFAEKDGRSIARYVQLWLTYIASCPYSPAPTKNPEMKELILEEEHEDLIDALLLAGKAENN